MGKGSSRRPAQISNEEWDKRWEAIDWGSRYTCRTATPCDVCGDTAEVDRFGHPCDESNLRVLGFYCRACWTKLQGDRP